MAEAIRRAARLDVRLAGAGDARLGATRSFPDAAHQELARTVARRSLTLLTGAELLPILPGTSVVVIEFPSRRPSPVEEGGDPAVTLGGVLLPLLARMRHVVLDAAYDADDAERAVAAAAEADLVVLATRDAYLREDDRRLVASVASNARASLLVALRNPYDVAALPGTTGAAAAYADVPATLEALADALTGRAGWPGTLPVALPAAVANAVPAA